LKKLIGWRKVRNYNNKAKKPYDQLKTSLQHIYPSSYKGTREAKESCNGINISLKKRP
jgi:hypothetical protein